MTVNNVVTMSQEVQNISSHGESLHAGDIDNIATVLDHIVAIKEEAYEVSDQWRIQPNTEFGHAMQIAIHYHFSLL